MRSWGSNRLWAYTLPLTEVFGRLRLPRKLFLFHFGDFAAKTEQKPGRSPTPQRGPTIHIG